MTIKRYVFEAYKGLIGVVCDFPTVGHNITMGEVILVSGSTIAHPRHLIPFRNVDVGTIESCADGVSKTIKANMIAIHCYMKKNGIEPRKG